MKHLKYALVAALGLILPSQASAEGGYMQASIGYGSMGDISAPYREDTGQTYELDDGDLNLGATFGWDLGNIAIELKANYIEGAVDKVASVAVHEGNEYNYAAITLGALYQFDEIEIEKSVDIGLTPYVGLGVGYDGGYMNAQQNTEINCDAVGCKSGDDVSDLDVAGRARQMFIYYNGVLSEGS